MGKVMKFGMEIADILRQHSGEAGDLIATEFIKRTLKEANPARTEESLNLSVSFWLEQTKSAMTEHLI